MSERAYNVLFLCSGNSARSILAEGILRRDGEGRFKAFSAGSQAKGSVNPLALKVLRAHGYPIDGYRSKSCDGLRDHRLWRRCRGGVSALAGASLDSPLGHRRSGCGRRF
jgi:Low molecular weight phosphotyrosine protein phosphatase